MDVRVDRRIDRALRLVQRHERFRRLSKRRRLLRARYAANIQRLRLNNADSAAGEQIHEIAQPMEALPRRHGNPHGARHLDGRRNIGGHDRRFEPHRAILFQQIGDTDRCGNGKAVVRLDTEIHVVADRLTHHAYDGDGAPLFRRIEEAIRRAERVELHCGVAHLDQSLRRLSEETRITAAPDTTRWRKRGCSGVVCRPEAATMGRLGSCPGCPSRRSRWQPYRRSCSGTAPCTSSARAPRAEWGPLR